MDGVGGEKGADGGVRSRDRDRDRGYLKDIKIMVMWENMMGEREGGTPTAVF